MIKKILLFIWQLPQNIVGFCIYFFHQYFCKHESPYIKITNSDGITYYAAKHVNNRGISLGQFIFIDSDRLISQNVIKHEYGHQLQSLRLGWLYLIIIGFPSAIGNLIYTYTSWKPFGSYYNQLWEKWADHLGGVKRNNQ